MSTGGAGDSPDTRWLAAAYDEHAYGLVRYLSARVGASVAEDLLSETFVVALRRSHTFDRSRGTPAAWLFGIATNILREHHRQEALHWRTLERVGFAGIDAAPVTERVAEAVDAQAAARLLIPHLRALDLVDRDILLLMTWAHLTPTEVGSALDMPAATVRSRLHRLRLKLRSVMPLATEKPPETPHNERTESYVPN